MLKSNPALQVGIIENNRTYAQDIGESLNIVLDANFICQGTEEVVNLDCIEGMNPITTPKRVKDAIESFGPFWAPGPDEMFTTLMVEAGNNLIKILVKIYSSCIKVGYTPKQGKDLVLLKDDGKGSRLVC